MACLAFNPVMNIMALPFALVVSVIASTTVFRNVFILYDAFAGNSNNGGSSAQRGISESGMNRMNTPRINLTQGASSHHVMTNDIPLAPYKNGYASNHHYSHHEIGGITVHKVVDVDVEVETDSPNSTVSIYFFLSRRDY